MNRIIVDVNPYQTRVALLKAGALQEVYVESESRRRIAGNIYKGRVANVLPGMDAAFVDLGLEKNAFLYAGDIMADKSDFEFPGGAAIEIKHSISEIVRQEQEIIVQVVKEPTGTKGARVTSNITLPGRTLVLMPTVNYIGVSRRIGDEAERARLKEIMERIKPPDQGVIVRTAAMGESEETLRQNIDYLCGIWQSVSSKGAFVPAPRLIHAEETLALRTVRDLFTPDIDEIIINDREHFEKLRALTALISQESAKKVHYSPGYNLFDEFDLEGKIDKLLARKVWLRNGGYLVVDQTEALTVIDVNTGKFVGSDNLQETLFATNREAAIEIARQLRLRDISGIIIIDFIDMDEQVNKELILETLTEELKKDRTKTNVLGITQLGLVEMTRKKVRRNIGEMLQATCQYCRGDGRVLSAETVAHKVGRALKMEYHLSGGDEAGAYGGDFGGEYEYAQESMFDDGIKETRRDYRGAKIGAALDGAGEPGEHDRPLECYLVEVHPSVAAQLDRVESGVPLMPRKSGATVYVRPISFLHIGDYKITKITDPRLLEGMGDVKAYSG